jgi:uncharacterized protein YpmS
MFEDAPVQKNPRIPRSALILLTLFIIIVLLGLMYIKMSSSEEQDPSPVKTATEVTPSVSSTTNSLGGEIYEKAQNPLEGKIETQTPVANPINDAYKNPFE